MISVACLKEVFITMKRLLGLLPYLLLLCAGAGFNAKGLIQTVPDTLLGTWSGQVKYGGESKLMALRFEVDNKKRSTVLFFDIPDMKFHNLGPIPLSQQGDEYKSNL